MNPPPTTPAEVDVQTRWLRYWCDEHEAGGHAGRNVTGCPLCARDPPDGKTPA